MDNVISYYIYVGFQCDLIPLELHVFSDTHFLKLCQIQGVPADTENYYGVRPKDMVKIFYIQINSGIQQLKIFHPPLNVICCCQVVVAGLINIQQQNPKVLTSYCRQ